MTSMWSAADIARASRLPPAGMMLMIECYFDDSGTHGGASVVVWGGVIGTIEQFKSLDERWAILLQSPLPAKPKLRRFHLFDCRSGMGEFADYSLPERDRVQYLFREAMIESGIMPVAFGVDVSAWETRVKGLLRQMLPPESVVFGVCARTALEIAEDNKSKVSMVFDEDSQGRNQRLYFGARELLPEGARRSAATFVSVSESAGLQAADVVANYFYRYAQRWLRDRNVLPEPHFLHLLNNSEQQYYGMFSESEIDIIVEGVISGLRARGVVL